jgi:hypothetical protein
MSGGQPIDGLADALGQVVARERSNWQRAFAEERETWRREAERRDAEARALLAEKTVEILNVRREMDALVQEHRDRFQDLRKEFSRAYASIEGGFTDAFGRSTEALKAVYDRVETQVSDLQAFRDDLLSRVGRAEAQLEDRLATLRDGKDADPAQFASLAAALTERVEAKLATVRDGKDFDPAQFETLEAALHHDLARLVADVCDQLRNDPNLKGAPGEPGRLPIVKEWTRGVHYEGAVVTCGGSLWQASTDTGEPPGHEDWTLLAAKGRDAAEIEHRGSYAPDTPYSRLNIVALDGGAFMALRDNPGACPGDDWRLLVARGKPGKPGEPGPRSTEPGRKGDPGVGIADISVDGFLLVVSLTNGVTLARDLQPMFEEYHAQVRP